MYDDAEEMLRPINGLALKSRKVNQPNQRLVL